MTEVGRPEPDNPRLARSSVTSLVTIKRDMGGYGWHSVVFVCFINPVFVYPIWHLSYEQTKSAISPHPYCLFSRYVCRCLSVTLHFSELFFTCYEGNHRQAMYVGRKNMCEILMIFRNIYQNTTKLTILCLFFIFAAFFVWTYISVIDVDFNLEKGYFDKRMSVYVRTYWVSLNCPFRTVQQWTITEFVFERIYKCLTRGQTKCEL